MTVEQVNEYWCNMCGCRSPFNMQGLRRVQGGWSRIPKEGAEQHICDSCGNDIARLFPQPDPRLEEAKALLRRWKVGDHSQCGSPITVDDTMIFLAKLEAPTDAS